jgi:hypothetical protein
MTTRILWILALSCLLALPAAAGDALSIRLVEATNDEKGDNAGLEDVIDVLKKNLSYKTYTLVAKASVALPAKNAVHTLGKFTVTCSGKKDKFTISIARDKKELLNTSVKLQPGSPLVLGGFSSEKGKMALVFVVE